MKLKKKILSMLATVGLIMGSVGTANACNVIGKVTSLVEDGTTLTGTAVTHNAGLLPTIYYSFTTTNQSLKNQLSDALSGQFRTDVLTDGTDCAAPSPGVVKVIGVVETVTTYRDV